MFLQKTGGKQHDVAGMLKMAGQLSCSRTGLRWLFVSYGSAAVQKSAECPPVSPPR